MPAVRSTLQSAASPKARPTGSSADIAPPGPLSGDHLRELSEARYRARKVRRAATFATISGWTMALFAALTLLGALFGDIVSLVAGASLAVIAYNELLGAAMLRRLDAAGARRLGYNQLGLGALIVVYAAWSLFTSLRTPALGEVGGSTGDTHVDAMVERISHLVAYSLYGGLALVGIVAPGLTSWYYFTRERAVRAVVQQTPSWVIAAMRAAG